MKVAKLPTGDILEFPLHTPDEAIDQTVAAHLQEALKKKKAKDDETAKDKDAQKARQKEMDGESRLMHQERMQYKQNRDHVTDTRESRNQKQQQDWRMADVAYREKNGADKAEYHKRKLAMHQNANAMLAQLVAATVAMNERLNGIENSIQGMADAQKSIDTLSKVVMSGVHEITAKLGMDKKIVFDHRGRPTGLKHVESEGS